MSIYNYLITIILYSELLYYITDIRYAIFLHLSLQQYESNTCGFYVICIIFFIKCIKRENTANTRILKGALSETIARGIVINAITVIIPR